MAQRMFNLSKWQLVRDGEAISYNNPKQRMVILDVNCPTEVAFYVDQKWDDVQGNPEWVNDLEAGRFKSDEREGYVPGVLRGEDGSDRLLTFVALAKGRDTLEFQVEGAFDLVVEGGPAYVYTLDGQDTSTHIVAPAIFTQIANRRQRNPHLEMIEYQMRLNQDAFRDRMEAEVERRLEELKTEVKATYAEQRDQGPPAGRPLRQDRQVPGVLPAEREEPVAAEDESDSSRVRGGGSKRKRAKAPVGDDEEDA